MFNIFSSRNREKNDYCNPLEAPHLVCRNSFGSTMDYVLTRAETTIGKGKKYHIVISDNIPTTGINYDSCPVTPTTPTHHGNDLMTFNTNVSRTMNTNPIELHINTSTSTNNMNANNLNTNWSSNINVSGRMDTINSATSSINSPLNNINITTSHTTRNSSIVLNSLNNSTIYDTFMKRNSISNSKLYAVIIRKKSRSFIEDKISKDKESSGCISINNISIKGGTPILLNNGDIIQIGTMSMTFYEKQEKVSAPPVPLDIKFDSLNRLPVMEDSSLDRGINTLETFNVENMPNEDLQRDYEKMRCIYELSKISSEKGFTHHYEKAVDLVFSLLPDVEFGAIVLKDKHQGTTKINHFREKPKPKQTKDYLLKDSSELMYSSFFNQVMDSKKPLLRSWKETGSIIGSPLLGRDQVLGLLCFYSLYSQLTVSEKDLEIIAVIGNHTAMAIDKTMLLIEQNTSATQKDLLSRFLPSDLVNNIVEPKQIIDQIASKVNASILFVEIKDFSLLRNHRTPEQVVAILNEFYKRLECSIFKFNGVLDKCLGEKVMALFGTLENLPCSEHRAFQAAFDIQDAVEGPRGLNNYLSELGYPPITVGIGLHSGEVIAGFFGSPLRLEYSVQGDHVDAAYSICQMAKDNEILASETITLAAYPTTTSKNYYEKDRKHVKGKKKPLSIFQIKGSDLIHDKNLPSDSPLVVHKQTGSHKVKSKYNLDQPQNYPYLIYQYSYGVNELHFMKNEKTKIGRDVTNDIIIRGNGNGVSRYHAEIERIVRDGYVIGITCTDKNSTLGVYINAEKIQPNVGRRLQNGDKIGFGNAVVMEYYSNRSFIPDRFLQNSFEDFERTVEFTSPAADMSISINAEIETEKSDFIPVNLITDFNELREDYVKLRLISELSTKLPQSSSLSIHLKKALDYIFNILPCVDTGVIVLLDTRTGPNAKLVKYRTAEDQKRNDKLSSTIFKRVYDTKKKIISTDATHDSELQEIESVRNNPTKTVICLPLSSHQNVHGIMYLSSLRILRGISKKDLSVLDAISNQMCVAIENSKMISEDKIAGKMRDHLSRYLSPVQIKKITDPNLMVDTKGSKKKVTVMVLNIIDFSLFREKNSAAEVGNTLNAYFELAVRIVFKHDGIVDKYIGNQFIAVFGALDNIPGAESRAAFAALEIKDAIEIMNQERDSFKKDHINIKIGISAGEVIAGFIGRRFDYTLLGDAVDLADYCMNVAQSNEVVTTETTFASIADKVNVSSVGTKTFQGNPVKLFEITSKKISSPTEKGLPSLP